MNRGKDLLSGLLCLLIRSDPKEDLNVDRDPTDMSKLLIVDDDVTVLNQLARVLSERGWQVDTASTGKDAQQFLTHFKYDFILLDWSLPDTAGVEICRNFRAQGGLTPIFMVTGRGEITDKEEGFAAGADDYLTKPFDVRELLARLQSAQRRSSRMQAGRLQVQGVTLDLSLRTLSHDGEKTHLSSTECSLLDFLFRHPDRFFSASDLFESVWPSDTDASEGTVKAHVKLLRRKLSLIGCPDLIKTVRGSGYIIESK